MSLLNIALLQLTPGETLAENLARGIAGCRRAKALEADTALFPEMWSNACRRPKTYALLLEERREAPFLRPDYRG